MIYIESKILPPSGFQAMSLFGFCIKRKDAQSMTDEDFNHEEIHHVQQRDTQTLSLIIGLICCVFIPSIWWLVGALLVHPLLYGILSLIALIINIKQIGFKATIKSKAYYYDNLLEVEAYRNEKDFKYLEHRRPFISWIKYRNIFKNN